jgi:uncharacterized membrane protein YvbJ
LVYCTKCGTQNEDNAYNCVNCGESLVVHRRERRGWEEEIEVRAEEIGERAEEFGKRMEAECFGLPYGNSIIWIIIGLAIIIVGMRELLGWSVDIVPFAAIVLGALIIAGVLYKQSQRKP